MFKKYKQLVIGITLGALIFGGVSVATNGLKSIDVMYNNIKIAVDGKEVKTDSEPFIYEGRTYVPIRVVSEALGADIDWNDKTKTVEIFKDGRPEPSKEVNVEEKVTIGDTTELKEPKIGAPGIYNGAGGHSTLYDFVKFGFRVNSAGGVSLDWVGQNLTGKTINYYTANIAMYNPVGDPAYDTITGKNKVALRFVGPVEPSSIMVLGELGVYSNVCHRVVIESFDIIYSDGTEETIPYWHSTTLRLRD